MKNVFGYHYFAIEALCEVPLNIKELVEATQKKTPLNNGFNVIKVSEKLDEIAFLYYSNLEVSPHPSLVSSTKINLVTNRRSQTHFSGNPFILHRLETILAESNPRRTELLDLTNEEQRLGLFSRQHIRRIGRKNYWNALCMEFGLTKSLA